MNLGLAVFLSIALLCLTILYTNTRESWDWKLILKRIAKRAAVIFIILLIGFVLSLLVYFVVSKISALPYKQKELYGVSLYSTKEDILFSQGRPSNSGATVWTYPEQKITFQGNKVVFIVINDRPIQGICWYSEADEVIAKFGKNAVITSSPDGLKRLYCYPQYNLFFVLEKGRVAEHGIYNPSLGGITFITEQVTDDMRPITKKIQQTSKSNKDLEELPRKRILISATNKTYNILTGVTINLLITNECEEDVAALKGRVVVNDVFGEHILTNSFEFHDLIKSKTSINKDFALAIDTFSTKWKGSLAFVDFKDLRISCFPESIVFADGKLNRQ